MAKFSAPLPRSRLEKPRSREPSQPSLSYEHIENFTKDSEVRRDLGNRASPVNPKYIQAPDVAWNKSFKAKVTEKYDAWMAEHLKFYFGRSVITYCFVAK